MIIIKQFIYLDNDIVNSILAQTENGFVTDISTETELTSENTVQKGGNAHVSGTAGGSLFKLAKAEATLDFEGNVGSESTLHSSTKELINKTLHDAAFNIVYSDVKPRKIDFSDKNNGFCGEYIEINRVFDFVDFDYLENLFSKGGIIDYLKKTDKEKIESEANEAGLNRQQQRNNSALIKTAIKNAILSNEKKYADVFDIIIALKNILPYKRMIVSYDGYLVPLDDKYFRVDPVNLGFKYGGEITCVGLITNIIGEDTNPNDEKNVFATIQFAVNEVLRTILPTKENNLCVIHPIAVYYGK